MNFGSSFGSNARWTTIQKLTKRGCAYKNKEWLAQKIIEARRLILSSKLNILGLIIKIRELKAQELDLLHKLGQINLDKDYLQALLKLKDPKVNELLESWFIQESRQIHWPGNQIDNVGQVKELLCLTKKELLELYWPLHLRQEALYSDFLNLHHRKTYLFVGNGQLYDQWIRKQPSKLIIKTQAA